MAPTRCSPASTCGSVAALLEGVGAVSYLDLRREAAKDDGQASLLDPAPADPPDASVTYALSDRAVTGKDRTRVVEGIARRRGRPARSARTRWSRRG